MRQYDEILFPEISGIVTSNTSLYPHVGHGIDLRKWMNDILSRYGHYVIVRKYDTSKRSKYWNEITKESVGGPPWEYTDYIVLARRMILTTGGVLSALEMPAAPGMISIYYTVFYLQWNAVYPPISDTDEIYELDRTYTYKPAPDEVTCNTMYNIIEAIDMRCDGGRNEYYICRCKQNVVGY